LLGAHLLWEVEHHAQGDVIRTSDKADANLEVNCGERDVSAAARSDERQKSRPLSSHRLSQFIAVSEGRTQAPDQARHFGLVVDDKDAVRERLRELGCQSPDVAWTSMTPGATSFRSSTTATSS
jgi:phosphatidylethanolamine-binding protein (PEBP) family uncharacterized protein